MNKMIILDSVSRELPSPLEKKTRLYSLAKHCRAFSVPYRRWVREATGMRILQLFPGLLYFKAISVTATKLYIYPCTKIRKIAV